MGEASAPPSLADAPPGTLGRPTGPACAGLCVTAEGVEAAGEVCSRVYRGSGGHLPILREKGFGRPPSHGSEAARRLLLCDHEASRHRGDNSEPPRGFKQGAAAPHHLHLREHPVSSLLPAFIIPQQAHPSYPPPFLPSRPYLAQSLLHRPLHLHRPEDAPASQGRRGPFPSPGPRDPGEGPVSFLLPGAWPHRAGGGRCPGPAGRAQRPA